jgi:hypothetical protein
VRGKIAKRIKYRTRSINKGKKEDLGRQTFCWGERASKNVLERADFIPTKITIECIRKMSKTSVRKIGTIKWEK